MLLALALFSPLLIGYLAAETLLPNYKPRWVDLSLKISLGAGLGSGLTSCLYFLVWSIIGPSTKSYVFAEAFAVLAAGVACWFCRDRTVIDNARAKPSGWSWILLFVLLAALGLAASVYAQSAAHNPYGEWDAWSIWNLRARFFAQSDASWRNAISPLLNRPAAGGATHPDYPLLLSGAVARCWNLAGSMDAGAPLAVAAIFFFATIGLIVSALAALRGWSAAMLGGLVLLSTASFQTVGPFQYADIPLGFCYLAAFAVFLLSNEATESRGRPLILAGLVMGLAAWTKNEGVLFALVFTMGVLACTWFSGRAVRMIALLIAGAAAPLAIALYFKFFIAPGTGTYAHLTVAATAHQLVEMPRHWQIAKAFWDQGLRAGLAIPALCVAVLAGCLGIPVARRRDPAILASTGAFIATLIGYFVTYLATPLDLTWHLSTSVSRLLVQLVPSFVFLSLVAIRTVEETAILPQTTEKPARTSGKKVRKAGAH